MRFVILIFFCFFIPSLSWADKAGEKLKLPDYYLGAWETTAKRTGDFVHVIKNDGTIVGYFNFGKKEKYTNITYRILDIQKDSVVLFVREVDLKDPFTGKSPADATYSYWTFKPDGTHLGLPFMWIMQDTFNPWDRPANPDKKSDAWLLDYYNTEIADKLFNQHGHFRLPSGRFPE
jgi:hypothetical protein